MFELYSPQNLRDAIEIELRNTDDPKTAAIIAMKRLKKDPDYYQDNFGVMTKARVTKYIRKFRGKDSKLKYKYREDVGKGRSDEEQIKLKMIFDSNGLYHSFDNIGFEARIGNENISEKAFSKTKEIENNINVFDKEHVSAIDEDGNVLFSKIGNYNEIDFSEDETRELRNVEVLTHTHPEDKSFSAEDVFLALSLGVKELRVKTPENTYFFKIGHKDVGKARSNNRTFMVVLKELNYSVRLEISKKVRNGDMTIEDAEKQHREILWNMVEKSPVLSGIFFIGYGKENK